MSVKEFKHILKGIKPYTKYIYLHIKGEPLSHWELPEFLDIAEDMGFFVNITTNGTLIDKIGDKIVSKPALRQINFSLHSFDGDLEKIDNNKYLENILSFMEKSKIFGNTYISLRLWNFHNGNKDTDQMRGNKKILERLEKYFKLDYKLEDKLVPGKGVKLENRIYLNSDLEFKWPKLEDEAINESGFCYGLRTQIGILVDGTVVPCCLDGEGVINLGNIFKEPFEKIINSKRAKNIYHGFSENKAVEELCKKCTFKDKF
jgi:radical SAM protein with 4Fe4S-binding SPASM domain